MYPNPEITYIKGRKLSRIDRVVCNVLIRKFMGLHDIELKRIIIDLRTTRNEYTSEGLFAGFQDMYDAETDTLYYNPYGFVEFQRKIKPQNLAHLAMHELIHTKQLKTKEMFVSADGSRLRFRKKWYNRAPFNVDLFNRIRDLDGALGEEYHWRALPWERSAYRLPEEFMGQPLWRAYT